MLTNSYRLFAEFTYLINVTRTMESTDAEDRLVKVKSGQSVENKVY